MRIVFNKSSNYVEQMKVVVKRNHDETHDLLFDIENLELNIQAPIENTPISKIIIIYLARLFQETDVWNLMNKTYSEIIAKKSMNFKQIGSSKKIEINFNTIRTNITM